MDLTRIVYARSSVASVSCYHGVPMVEIVAPALPKRMLKWVFARRILGARGMPGGRTEVLCDYGGGRRGWYDVDSRELVGC